MKFDDSLLIEPEYSTECKKHFSKNIDFHFFPALITVDSKQDAETTATILRDLLKEEDAEQREKLLTRLPDVIENCNKVLSLKYRIIEEEDEDNQVRKKIMVIINDITQETTLQNKLIEEKERFEYIVKLIAHYDEFQTLVDNYKAFWEKDYLDIMHQQDLTPEDKRSVLIGTISAFKESFAGFGLKRNLRHLHHLEAQLEEANSDYHHFFDKIRTKELYLNWLKKDIKKVHKHIPPHILQSQKAFKSERKAIKQVMELLNALEETEALKKTKKLLQKLQ